MKDILDKVIPTLLIALVFAMFTLFRTVDRNKEDIKYIKTRQVSQFEYIVEIRDIAKDIQARYLAKDKYYQDRLKDK